MLTTKLKKGLRDFAIEFNESDEAAEQMIVKFEEAFDKLGKYDQLEYSLDMESGNWVSVFEKLGIF
jgi:hypothetical protein